MIKQDTLPFFLTLLARLPTSQVASKPTIASWLSVVASWLAWRLGR